MSAVTTEDPNAGVMLELTPDLAAHFARVWGEDTIADLEESFASSIAEPTAELRADLERYLDLLTTRCQTLDALNWGEVTSPMTLMVPRKLALEAIEGMLEGEGIGAPISRSKLAAAQAAYVLLEQIEAQAGQRDDTEDDQ